MSILDINLNDVPDLQKVADGEYQFQIKSVHPMNLDGATDKTPYLRVQMGFVSEPNAEDLWHNIFLPKPGDDESKKNTKLRMLKTFCQAFNLPLDQRIDTDSWVGAQGWAVVGMEMSAEYGDKNVIKRCIVQH